MFEASTRSTYASSEIFGSLGRPTPDFFENGACKGIAPHVFFPTTGQSPAEAQRVCARCEVREECLEYALTESEIYGVWGGLSERQRRKLTKDRRNASGSAELCRNGHPKGDYTILDRSGKPYCSRCRRATLRRYYVNTKSRIEGINGKD